MNTSAPPKCRAYIESRSVPLAHGGRRYARCKNKAVTERTRTERKGVWEAQRTYALCGTHAAMWDDGRPPRLTSDE